MYKTEYEIIMAPSDEGGNTTLNFTLQRSIYRLVNAPNFIYDILRSIRTLAGDNI